MFIEVRSYDNYLPANIMLQRLEEEGIKVYLQDEHTVTIDPILSNAIGGVKLMVFQDQLERAVELINGFEKQYRESITCVHCGSHNVHLVLQRTNAASWITAIITWIFGSYAIASKKVYTCLDCGTENPDPIA
jgi:hypothetical protein